MLDDISLFIKLYETKSFKKCSELINTSPATISKHLADLEYKLGKQLIRRTTKTFEPTAYGNYIYNNLRNIPAFAESVIRSYNVKQKNNSKGTLNVALGVSVSYELISPYIGEFINLHPNVKLRIKFISSITTWPSEDTSVVLGVTAIDDPKLHSRFVRVERAKFFCSKKYANIYGLPEQPNQLVNHKIIGTIHPTMSDDHMIMTNSTSNETFLLDLSGVSIKTNDILHMKKIGVNCNYIFGAIESLVFQDIQNGDLIPVLPDWHVLEINYHIITKRTITSLEQSFVDFIYNCMNKSYNRFMKSAIHGNTL